MEILDTHTIFVDTCIYPNKSDFTLNLANPIIINEDEKLTFKLINFSSLNSIYNISSDLNNNTFNLKRFKRTLIWAQNPALTTSQIISQNDMTPYYNTTTNLPIDSGHVALVLNGITTYVERIFMTDYFLSLRDYRITTTNLSPTERYFYNVFLNNPITDDTSKMMNVFDTTGLNISKEFTIEKRNGEYEQINRIEISVYVKFTLSVIGTITATLYGVDLSDNLITITNNTLTYTTQMLVANNTHIITLIPPQPNIRYKSYHIKYTKTGFNSFAFNSLYFSKINIIRNDWGFFPASGSPPELDQEYNITIPNGIYSSTNLFTKMNALLASNGVSNTKFSLQTYNYKTLITNTDILTGLIDTDYNAIHTFTFPTKLGKMLGFESITSVGRGSSTEALNTINLINFQKYLITTSLKLTNSPQMFLKEGEYRAEGIGDVVAIINKDIAPFEYINYTNLENTSYHIDNKIINNISFKILNEYKQNLPTFPSCTMHFELIKTKNKNLT